MLALAIASFTNLQSPPEPIVAEATYVDVPPTVTITLRFNVLMNTTVTPPFVNWVALVDGVPRAVSVYNWVDGFNLEMGLAAGAPVAVDVTLEYLAANVGLRSTLSKQVQPFGPIPVLVP